MCVSAPRCDECISALFSGRAIRGGFFSTDIFSGYEVLDLRWCWIGCLCLIHDMEFERYANRGRNKARLFACDLIRFYLSKTVNKKQVAIDTVCDNVLTVKSMNSAWKSAEWAPCLTLIRYSFA